LCRFYNTTLRPSTFETCAYFLGPPRFYHTCSHLCPAWTAGQSQRNLCPTTLRKDRLKDGPPRLETPWRDGTTARTTLGSSCCIQATICSVCCSSWALTRIHLVQLHHPSSSNCCAPTQRDLSAADITVSSKTPSASPFRSPQDLIESEPSNNSLTNRRPNSR
jgi:hypothetical protein